VVTTKGKESPMWPILLTAGQLAWQIYKHVNRTMPPRW
jgi:hypothetical protein